MAGRRLAPEETALWRKVTGSVRALHGPATRPFPRVEAKKGATFSHAYAAAMPEVRACVRPRVAPGGRAAAPAPAPPDTLDRTWDKKIGGGRIVPDRTIDLHGCTQAMAHHRLDEGLDQAMRDGYRVILLVTGRPARPAASRIDLPLRGIIRESVGDWLSASRHRAHIAAVRHAHPRHGSAGALYIILRRPR